MWDMHKYKTQIGTSTEKFKTIGSCTMTEVNLNEVCIITYDIKNGCLKETTHKGYIALLGRNLVK